MVADRGIERITFERQGVGRWLVTVLLSDGRQHTYEGDSPNGAEFDWVREPVEIPPTAGFRQFAPGPQLDLSARVSLRRFTQTADHPEGGETT